MQNKKSEKIQSVIDTLADGGYLFDTCRAMLLREKSILHVCENSTCDPITARLAIASLGLPDIKAFQAVSTFCEAMLIEYANKGLKDAEIITSLNKAYNNLK